MQLQLNTTASKLSRPQHLAACANGTGNLNDLFFSENAEEIAEAKTICSTCILQSDCLQAALQRREPWGVWGGELLSNGHILAVKRKRGRPPKLRNIEGNGLEARTR
jgi:WhiB family transcriptional regulator, redox-sensing transcriptional regulator